MHRIFRSLCQLLAPITAFTADEAWRFAEAGASVHLQEFAVASDRGREATDLVQELLKLRGVIGQAIERARQEKLIGNALEAAVVLKSNSDATTKVSKEELEEFFILSDLTVEHGKEPAASVTKTMFALCACWRHWPTVGQSKEHPDLCDRREAVVNKAKRGKMNSDERGTAVGSICSAIDLVAMAAGDRR
jgi:isoleucyl-tRNA synthetase